MRRKALGLGAELDGETGGMVSHPHHHRRRHHVLGIALRGLRWDQSWVVRLVPASPLATEIGTLLIRVAD
jgi:hypothetical protein